MHREEDCLVLERRTLRLALGCCIILLIFVFVFTSIIEPEALLSAGILFGFFLIMLVGTLLHDASPKRNLVITPTGLTFSKGILFYQEVEIKWNELNEVKWRAIASGETSPQTNIILVSKKGETKPYKIKYSHLGGRHVKGHIALFTAKRAIELIENLRDTESQQERVEMIKASKGMTTQRYKHSLVTIPLHHRVVLKCKVCESLSVYDKQKPKGEYRCPGCGSEEISEG